MGEVSKEQQIEDLTKWGQTFFDAGMVAKQQSDIAIAALKKIAWLRPAGPTKNKTVEQMERIAINAIDRIEALAKDPPTPLITEHREMRLSAQTVPYSSVVGGGLMLCDPTGRARFVVNFMGTTEGITKEETAAMSEQFAAWINSHGLTCPERK